jgi:DNA-binding SARP family transcriptional activator
LPLPWAVELAVLGARHGHTPAPALAQHLTSVAGEAVARELAVLDVDPAFAELFRPEQDVGEVTVRLLGEVAVSGPGLIGTDELRRRRVREMLAAVALDGPLQRDVLAERLWPGLDPERTAANLRVTLTYVRRIRADGVPVVIEDARGLALSPGVDTDHRKLLRLSAEADAARRAGAAGAALDSYMRALALVDGAPLAGTVAEQWFDDSAARIRLGVAALGVRAARLATELGDHQCAAAAAAAAIGADPYHEEAHRLAVGALLELGQPAAAEQAATRATAYLDELGIELEPATERVFRRADTSPRPVG